VKYIGPVIVLLFLSFPAVAQPVYERVLVPLHHPGEEIPGAYESRWITNLQIFNANDVFAIVTPATRCDIGICAQRNWPPQSFASAGGRGLRGLFNYIGGTGVDADRVVYHLRIQDVSRQSQTWGTEIPVARRRDFRSDAIHLLNVPLHPRFRQTLRIYDYGGKPARVRVRVFPMEPSRSSVLIGQLEIELAPWEVAAIPEEPSYPAYAQIGDLLPLFPDARTEAQVHIEIAPIDGSLIWAFAAITNNETQHVTVIAPR
jgi:hypothetical protein